MAVSAAAPPLLLLLPPATPPPTNCRPLRYSQRVIPMKFCVVNEAPNRCCRLQHHHHHWRQRQCRMLATKRKSFLPSDESYCKVWRQHTNTTTTRSKWKTMRDANDDIGTRIEKKIAKMVKLLEEQSDNPNVFSKTDLEVFIDGHLCAARKCTWVNLKEGAEEDEK